MRPWARASRRLIVAEALKALRPDIACNWFERYEV
jgi:hypothetical protein